MEEAWLGARPSSEEEVVSGWGLPLCAYPHLAGPRGQPQVDTAPSWKLVTPLPRAGKTGFTRPVGGTSAKWKMRPAPPWPLLALAAAPACGRASQGGGRTGGL